MPSTRRRFLICRPTASSTCVALRGSARWARSILRFTKSPYADPQPMTLQLLHRSQARKSRVCTKVYVRKTIFYRRLRHGGDQYVRVEHVHINEGAQAVIGNVHPHESGRAQLPEKQIRRDDDDEGAAP